MDAGLNVKNATATVVPVNIENPSVTDKLSIFFILDFSPLGFNLYLLTIQSANLISQETDFEPIFESFQKEAHYAQNPEVSDQRKQSLLSHLLKDVRTGVSAGRPGKRIPDEKDEISQFRKQRVIS